MSETFQNIISQHPKSLMQLIYWVTFLMVIIISLAFKRRFLSIGTISLLLFTSMLLQTEVIHNWWHELDQAVKTLQDEKWIADHDSGKAITDLAIVAETGFAWIITTIVCMFKTKKKTEKV